MLRRSLFLGLAALLGLPRGAGAVGMQRPGRRAEVDLLRCVKHERKLYAYRDGEVVMTFNVALGREPRGHKVQEGDGRTPEGRYYITAARHDSDFHLSLKISYPNAEDRARARALGVQPGGQIMLHGLDPGIEAKWHDRHWLFNWTNGCIAVTNDEMEVLWDSVALGTPIEILA
jgi:murein L,D-transpeptidase YafK